jgi:hypothetical protein
VHRFKTFSFDKSQNIKSIMPHMHCTFHIKHDCFFRFAFCLALQFHKEKILSHFLFFVLSHKSFNLWNYMEDSSVRSFCMKKITEAHYNVKWMNEMSKTFVLVVLPWKRRCWKGISIKQLRKVMRKQAGTTKKMLCAISTKNTSECVSLCVCVCLCVKKNKNKVEINTFKYTIDIFLFAHKNGIHNGKMIHDWCDCILHVLLVWRLRRWHW